MTRNGHRLSAIPAFAIAYGTFLASVLPSGNVTLFGLCLFCIGSGVTAPDWLEIAWWVDGPGGKRFRKSVIKHRTFTHWVLLWVAIFWWCLLQAKTVPLYLAGASFAFGCLIHLFCDFPNPMGVPVLLPTAQWRMSLKWWKSGNFEGFTLLLLSGLGAAVIFRAELWVKAQEALHFLTA